MTAQHVGSVPTYISSGLFELMKKAVENPKWCNDWKGVWHDVLTMSLAAYQVPAARAGRWLFDVIITGVGRKRRHCLVICLDGAGVTLMLPEDC